MSRSLSDLTLRVLRVPTEPSIQKGAREVVLFRASPKYLRYKVVIWAIGQIGALIGLVIGLIFLSRFDIDQRYVTLAFETLTVLAWVAYVVQLPFSYLLVRLDFSLRWYILTERSLRIREGIVALKEKTMTFANVQQISVRQNPLQRVLGIADVQVRTAGGGGPVADAHGKKAESLHEAWFRGVDDAESIRDAIRDRVRLQRDAGLGDPDDAETDGSRDSSSLADAIAAAHELHREIRGLGQGIRAVRA